jgi:hypothetical protein
MFQSFAGGGGLPYNVNEITHEDFFILKHCQFPLKAIKKKTENETVKTTDIKIVKVDKRSPSKRPALRKITKKL